MIVLFRCFEISLFIRALHIIIMARYTLSPPLPYLIQFHLLRILYPLHLIFSPTPFLLPSSCLYAIVLNCVRVTTVVLVITVGRRERRSNYSQYMTKKRKNCISLLVHLSISQTRIFLLHLFVTWYFSPCIALASLFTPNVFTMRSSWKFIIIVGNKGKFT